MQNQIRNLEPERGLRCREAAAMLGISVSCLWRHTRLGLLRNKKLGGCTVWLMSEIQRYLEGKPAIEG